MTGAFLDHARVHAGSQCQRRMGVPQVVQPDLGKPEPAHLPAEVVGERLGMQPAEGMTPQDQV